MANSKTPVTINARQIARKGIVELGAYVPGKPIDEVRQEYGLDTVIKLASNECQLPPPDKVLRAIGQEAENLCRYPDGHCRKLRRHLADHLGVSDRCLLFGNGAEECVRLIGQAFLDPGDNSLIPSPIYDAYDTAVRLPGATVVKIPMKDHCTDLQETADRVDERTKIVWLCSPANPTGTVIKKDQCDRFLGRMPDNVLVVLDEAYFEYVTCPDAAHATDYLGVDDRVIGLRTFSKAYGLAGLRIGYILAHPSVVDILSMVKLPFNVNILAQAAAIAGLSETAFVGDHVRMICEQRRYLAAALERRGATVVPSETNFLFVKLPVSGDALFKALLPMGIIVRPGSIWQRPDCIRLTVGTREQNDTFLAAFDAVLPAIRNKRLPNGD